MTFTIRIVGPCSGLQIPSILIQSINYRVLINCSEGLQRVYNATNNNIHKINTVLFTSNDIQTLGGMFGFLLTKNHVNETNRLEQMERLEKSKLSIYGPVGISHYIKSLSRLRQVVERAGTITSTELYPTYQEDIKVEVNSFLESKNNIVKEKLFVEPLIVVEGNSYLDYLHDEVENRKSEYELQNLHFASKGKNNKPTSVIESQNGSENNEKVFKKSYSSYMLRFKSNVRRLDVKKAQENFVKKGPDYGLLCQGIAVKNKNGDLVQPEQCTLPLEPDRLCYILHTAGSEDCISQLSEKIKSKAAKTDPENDGHLQVVFHLSDKKIASSETYQNLIINKINKLYETKKEKDQKIVHIFAGNGYEFQDDVNLKSNLITSILEKYTEPSLFPMITNQKLLNINKLDLEKPKFLSKNFASSDQAEYILGRQRITFHLSLTKKEKANALPSLRYQILDKDKFHIHEKIDNALRFAKSEDDLKEIYSTVKECDIKYPFFFEITTLGTGSSKPESLRNVSSILFTVHDKNQINHSFLLDVGEHTLYSLYKHFNEAKGSLVKEGELSRVENFLLNDLKVIFISHKHPDHFLGIFHVLKRREELLEKYKNNKLYDKKIIKKLIIILPDNVRNFFFEMEKAYSLDKDLYNIIRNNTFIQKQNIGEQGNEITFKNLTAKIKTVRVLHCSQADGIVLQIFPKQAAVGQKANGAVPDAKRQKLEKEVESLILVYSGDTMYCPDLVKAGKDCDILIHEATFDDDAADQARAKRHCTISKAIKAGDRMNAKRIILTHFSQRYTSYPNSANKSIHCYNKQVSERKTQRKVNKYERNDICAYDFMTLNSENINEAPKYNDIFKKIHFSESR